MTVTAPYRRLLLRKTAPGIRNPDAERFPGWRDETRLRLVAPVKGRHGASRRGDHQMAPVGLPERT
jgi:hypothetical protein